MDMEKIKKGCGRIYRLRNKKGEVTGHAKCGDSDRKKRYVCGRCEGYKKWVMKFLKENIRML